MEKACLVKQPGACLCPWNLKLPKGQADDEKIADMLQSLRLRASEQDIVPVGMEHRADYKTLELCLVGSLLSESSFHFPTFRNVLLRSWRLSEECKVVELRPNLFCFRFTSSTDLQRVLRDGPWSFDDRMLLLRRMDPRDTPASIQFSHIDLWVQIHGVPVGWLTPGTARALGGFLGKVLEVDDTDGADVASFLRVKVAIPVTEPRSRGDAHAD